MAEVTINLLGKEVTNVKHTIPSIENPHGYEETKVWETQGLGYFVRIGEGSGGEYNWRCWFNNSQEIDDGYEPELKVAAEVLNKVVLEHFSKEYGWFLSGFMAKAFGREL